MWDLNNPKNCIHILEENEDDIKSISISSDGNYIAAAFRSMSKNKGYIIPNKTYGYILTTHNKMIKRWDFSGILPQSGGKKKKLIDRFKKSDLIKIAKMHNLSLKTRDDKVKTKLQLFRSLKRKNLI
jgi:WD40 repeat protein